HREEQRPAVVAPIARQAEHARDLERDGKRHRRHGVLGHEERHERVHQEERQEQRARRVAKAAQDGDRDARGEAALDQRGGEDEGTEDEEDGLVAEERVRLLGREDGHYKWEDSKDSLTVRTRRRRRKRARLRAASAPRRDRVSCWTATARRASSPAR